MEPSTCRRFAVFCKHMAVGFVMCFHTSSDADVSLCRHASKDTLQLSHLILLIRSMLSCIPKLSCLFLPCITSCHESWSLLVQQVSSSTCYLSLPNLMTARRFMIGFSLMHVPESDDVSMSCPPSLDNVYLRLPHKFGCQYSQWSHQHTIKVYGTDFGNTKTPVSDMMLHTGSNSV